MRALRRFWWAIVLSCVIGGALGAAIQLQKTPVYANTVTFFATTPSNTDSGNPLMGDQFGQQRVNTYVKLLGSERLATQILENDPTLGLTNREVMGKISGQADLNTVLLTATVRDTSRSRGYALIKDVATQFPDLVNQIESRNGEQEAPVHLEVVSGPRQTPYPVSPRKKLGVAIGLFLGLVVGVAFALGRMLMDRTFRNPDDLRDASGAPVIGTIPFESRPRGGSSLAITPMTRSSLAESYRQLRTNLQFVDVEEQVQILVVTSSVPGEGKSTTSINLAITFAQTGKKVLLIEADLRRPKVSNYLGLEGAVGLTNVLAGQARLDDVLQPWGSTGLTVLPCGSVPPNPSELLGSTPMDDLLNELRERFELVILDTPPVLPVTDAAVASAHADGAVVVTRYGKTRIADVERSLELLRAVDARVVGMVLNRVPSKGVDAHRYESYQYHGDLAVDELPASTTSTSTKSTSTTSTSAKSAGAKSTGAKSASAKSA
jgi:capsular exopolysaccharide synthesis family protein